MGSKKKSIILRADGNSKVGLGHVYRLLAMAEMLKEDFNCIYAINSPDNFVLSQIQKHCSSYILLKNNIQYLTPGFMETGEEMEFDLEEYLCGDEIVVTDGYFFKEKYQLAVRQTGAKLVCVDDLAINNFICDLVINHAPGVDVSHYKILPGTKLLTGLKFALIRQPFFKPFSLKDEAERKAFISLGGSDYFGYTNKLVKFLLENDLFASLHVLTSSSFDSKLLGDLDYLQSYSSKVTLHYNLSADELVNVMDICTHAFVAASTVLIESYSRGLICFAGFYTDNQKFIYDGFINQRLAAGFGDFTALNREAILQTMKAEKDIKCLGRPFVSTGITKAFHLLSKNQQTAHNFNYDLREVIPSDMVLLFEWANDHEVRKSAINTKAISFQEHLKWFNQKINSEKSKIFILEVDNAPAGQARFDFNEVEKVWEISYTISREFRGRGLGKLLLNKCMHILQSFPLVGYVKEENIRSHNIFNGLGFTKMGWYDVKGTRLLKYVKVLSDG